MAELDNVSLEAIVAAILTAASVDHTGHGVPFMVNRYAQTLQELRNSGGATHARPKP
jgi:hypothetical protein